MTVAAFALLLLSGTSQAADGTLYQRLGDHDGLFKVVENCTDLWVKDPRIKATFDDVNLTRFKALLFDQLCELSGGPCKYKGRDMYKSHKGLHLDQAEFNALAEDLQIAMDDLDIPQSAQFELMALLAPMEHDITTRHRFDSESK
jgi:hemoglobin